MKLSALAIVAGAALSIHACSSRDDDVPPDAPVTLPDSVAAAADTIAAPVRDTTRVVDTPAPPPVVPRPGTRQGDTIRTRPPDRNPPIGDPAPIERPPVKLPRGDST